MCAKKASQNLVGLESVQGRLRLRLPAEVGGGKQKYLSLELEDTPENRKVAEALAEQMEADILFQGFFPEDKYRPDCQQPVEPTETPKQLTLLELWDRYTEFRQIQIAATTLKAEYSRYRNHIRKLPSQQIEEAIAIREYLVSQSPSVAKKVIIQLNACCKWGLKSGLIESNPFEGMAASIKTADKFSAADINPFTKDEIAAIIDGFESDRYYSYYTPFVKFLFLTGCRTSEAIGLRWKHISPDLTVITFCEAYTKGCRKDTKSHQRREFPINAQLRELLESVKPEECTPESLVFCSPRTAKEIDAHNFLNRAWKAVVAKTGITYRCQYNTRHTFITACLEANVPINQVVRWVGTTPEIILKHYAGSLKKSDVPELI